MASVIGYGRRARETYPERSSGGGSGALVLVGFDGIVEEFSLTPPEGFANLPKNVALDPVQVTFPAFTLGDTLEVDFRLNGVWSSEDVSSVATVQTQVLVSVDGGSVFYILSPSDSQDTTSVDAGGVVLLRSLDAVRIVDPMPVIDGGVPGTVPVTASPIVRVRYTIAGPDGLLLVNGSTDELEIPGAILKCSELSAASVFQGPLGQLVLE